MKDYPSHLFLHAIPKRNHHQKKKSFWFEYFLCSESCWFLLPWMIEIEPRHANKTQQRTHTHTPKMYNVNQHEENKKNKWTKTKLETKFCSRFCTNWARHKFMLMSFQVVPQRIPVTNDLQKHKYRDTREREHSLTNTNSKRREKEKKQSHRIPICSTLKKSPLK